MGKMYQYLKAALKRRRRKVKIMKDNGDIIKLGRPVYVKEILENHPNHAIFEGEAIRPLSQNTELRPGRLYFLISLKVDNEEYRYHSSTDLSKEELEKGLSRKVRIRLRKEELASLLSVEYSMPMKDLISPLIEHALSKQRLESLDSTSTSWRPSLQTIFEDQSPRGDSSVH